MSESVSESAGVEVGEIVECVVEQIMPYGAFVKIAKTGRKGMIHISELSYSFVKDINAFVKIGDEIKAKVIKIDERGRIDLSLKQTKEPPVQQSRSPRRMTSAQQDTNGRPPRDYRSVTRETRNERREIREGRVPVENREVTREVEPEEADSFEKKMASFLKTSEAKITDLNTRNSSRSGRGMRRRSN